MKQRRFSCACSFATVLATLLCIAVDRSRAADTPVDLLRLHSAVIASTTLPLAHQSQLSLLRDNDVSTTATLPVGADGTLDIVFALGETVTPEQLIVVLPATRISPPHVKVELLASNVSAHAGFRSLREERLQNTSSLQSFSFRATSAKWLLLRLTVARESPEISLAEVRVLGRARPPKTAYAFKESPAQAIDVLSQLSKIGSVDLELSADEKVLFDDAADGNFDAWSFAEAALLVSGLHDAQARRVYLQKIDMITTRARAAVASKKTSFERGEALLQWLHATGYLKHYSAEQSDLSRLLDDGTYNCVSSAIFYNVIAKNLGLDVRGVEVPDHAFSILYDGTRHVDIETTTRRGFHPARDAEAIASFRRLTGYEYEPSVRAKRREVNQAGLIGLIAYNHGVGLSKKQQYPEALGAYFRAMSLDAGNATAVKNTLATLGNWSLALAKQKKFERFLATSNIALQLAPNDKAFLHNRRYGWQEWIRATIDAGDADRALALVRRADREVVDVDFGALTPWVYIGPAEEHVKASKFEAGLAVTDRALTSVTGEHLTAIKKYRAAIMQRWFAHELSTQQYLQAAKVLDRSRSIVPEKQAEIEYSYGYLVQEWAADVADKRGAESSQQLVATLYKRYAHMPAVQKATRAHTHRNVHELVAAKQFAKALEVAKLTANYDAEHGTSMRVYVLSYWGLDHSQNKRWSQAAKMFGQARDDDQDDEQLGLNERSSLLNWATQTSQSGDWNKTLRVFDYAQRRFADDDVFTTSELALWWQRMEPDRQAKDWDKLLAMMRHLRLRHPTDRRMQQNEKHFWSQKAQPLTQGKRWAEALVVMTAARNRFPDDPLFKNNELACFGQVIQQHIDAKNWRAAISTIAKARIKHPRDASLRTNELACWQRLVTQTSEQGDVVTAMQYAKAARKRFPGDAKLRELEQELAK